jgi:hypothetical protein|tara:strand:- start:218 stop:430 length:213 start_codon:yes stop_codon:yes gene_type:complete
MKSFTESTKPAQIANDLATLDNETIAKIFLSVLKTRPDSIILKGIDKTLQDRLSLLDVDNVSDDGQQEMF